MQTELHEQPWNTLPSFGADASGADDAYLSPTRRGASPTAMTVADLRFPLSAVQDLATAYTSAARQRGKPHSMQLWRDGCHQAVLELSRVASNLPDTARCEALFWQIEGEEYHVSATFSRPERVVH